MAVVVGEHALRAHDGVTELAEVLDFLVLVFEAVHLRHRSRGAELLGVQLGMGCRRSLVDAVQVVDHVVHFFCVGIRNQVSSRHLRLLLLLLLVLSAQLGNYFHEFKVGREAVEGEALLSGAALRTGDLGQLALVLYTAKAESVAALRHELGQAVQVVELLSAIIADD